MKAAMLPLEMSLSVEFLGFLRSWRGLSRVRIVIEFRFSAILQAL